MNIYERLTRDHDLQRNLARKIMETSGDSDARRQLFDQFKVELEAHAAAEEQTLYASLLKKPETQGQARHSISEHQDAAELIKELESTDMTSGAWIQKFEKLKDEVVHHVDEEEQDVFPKARKLIDDDEAEKMASRFDDRKDAEAA